MSTFKKHVGRIKNTDRRCAVVYIQIPGNEDNALIVDTDSLPDRFHDALMDVIDSTEGQQTTHLHSLLSRRILPDMGLDIMNALHSYGFLRAIPIDNIVMYPAPNAPCPLRAIVDFINGEAAPKEPDTQLENRVLENQKSDVKQAHIDIAENILRQAQDLEDEANRKREQAYRMVPHLRPQVIDSPHVTEASANARGVSGDERDPSVVPLDNSPYGYGEALVLRELNRIQAEKAALGTPTEPVAQQLHEAAPVLPPVFESTVEDRRVFHVEVDDDLPPDVIEALKASVQNFHIEEVEEEGNQVDTSDSAIQEFLDRAALRADKADKEKWAAMQPKNPVGRPRKDGQPAGKKVVAAPAPKKRGRPPKAKKA